MLIEDFYKLLLKNKYYLTGLKHHGKIDIDNIQLIDISELKRTDPYKEIRVLERQDDPIVKDQDYYKFNPTMFLVNPAHNLNVELPFDTCLVKLSEEKLTDPDFNKGEIFCLFNNVEGSRETLVMVFAVVINKHIGDFQIFLLKEELGQALLFTPKDEFRDWTEKEKIKKNALILEIVIQCIATLKRCNKRETNLFTTTPIKRKGVKVNGKFTNISSKPIYIYTDRKVDIKIAQKYSRGNKVEHCICWPVRGHWRRLDDPKKRGKNVNGEYVVEGMTWVKPTVKGNKNAPLKQRTYIAKEGIK